MTAPAEEFLAYRPMLCGLAYRLLGSWHDAEDVVQEAYLRWNGTDRAAVERPRRYLTRVVARLAVDQLRTRCVYRVTVVTPVRPGGQLVERVRRVGGAGPRPSAGVGLEES